MPRFFQDLWISVLNGQERKMHLRNVYESLTEFLDSFLFLGIGFYFLNSLLTR